MITPRDIERKTMVSEKRKEAHHSIFAFYIGRPISYVLTVPLLYTNISPNIVTVVSIVCTLLGYGFLSFGKTVSMRLLGLFFFFLWNMGDGIDGNIARYKNWKSANGDLLDTLGGYMATVLMLLALGNAAYMDQEGWVFISTFLPAALGAVGACATIIPRTMMHRKLEMVGADPAVVGLKDKENYSIAKIIAVNICDPAGFQEVIFLFSILFHWNTQISIMYFAINVFVMLYSIHALLEKKSAIGGK